MSNLFRQLAKRGQQFAPPGVAVSPIEPTPATLPRIIAPPDPQTIAPQDGLDAGMRETGDQLYRIGQPDNVKTMPESTNAPTTAKPMVNPPALSRIEMPTGGIPGAAPQPAPIPAPSAYEQSSYPRPPEADHRANAPRGFWGNVKHRLEHFGKGALGGLRASNGNPIMALAAGIAGGINPKLADNLEYNTETLPRWRADQTQELELENARTAGKERLSRIEDRKTDNALKQQQFEQQSEEFRAKQAERNRKLEEDKKSKGLREVGGGLYRIGDDDSVKQIIAPKPANEQRPRYDMLLQPDGTYKRVNIDTLQTDNVPGVEGRTEGNKPISQAEAFREADRQAEAEIAKKYDPATITKNILDRARDIYEFTLKPQEGITPELEQQANDPYTGKEIADKIKALKAKAEQMATKEVNTTLENEKKKFLENALQGMSEYDPRTGLRRQ
jgi:hypothetical protein